MSFVKGEESHPGSEVSSPAPMKAVSKESRRNVVSLDEKKQEKVKAAAPGKPTSLVEKKVVGLRDPDVPNSDDPRFEDF